MKVLHLIFLIAIVVLKTDGVFSQLVNIESRRMQTDSVRLAGSADLAFNYQKTNDISLNVFKTSVGAQIKSKNLKHMLLVLGSYELARTNLSTINNAGFGHLRHNYKFKKWLR